MAKLVAQVKLTSGEKAAQKAAKIVASLLTSSDDVAAFNATLANVAAYARVLNQEGDGKGRRINGAESHSFADMSDRFVFIVKAGNIPTATAAPAAAPTT
jgi:hypothetical protein